ncbi:hypothetical protein [Sutcliffiella sp. NC1]|uniref:hypothetical protein n=1 Tax=Sutcliffiella sp. NC1 TaxID=3004096 RepID=UPI0022DE89CB|nr:hypothetical protein [Sutcliffiella sp. NC1]WBL13659.1 hypothetical protein O1A01_17280 [Sutcliffiella sp. NC1]
MNDFFSLSQLLGQAQVFFTLGNGNLLHFGQRTPFCINANLRMYKNDYLKMYSFDKLMDNILEVKEYYAYANQC